MPCTSSWLLHTPTHPLAATMPGRRSYLSSEHLNSCKHKFGHQPAGWVLLSAGDIVYRVCNEKQHLLQDFPMCRSRELLINEGHMLWRDGAANTFHTAGSETLLGFLKVTSDNLHSSQKRYCTHHEVTLFWRVHPHPLGWMKMN